MSPFARVLIAPDGFKGAASSVAAAAALARGLARAWPDATLTRLPLADGGDGTLAALAATEPGHERTRGVTGPHFEALHAGWWSPDRGPAVVEMARAAGLAVTRHRDPLRASTHGVGQLVIAAARAGHDAIWITCGGSATVDGGAGLLDALGFRLLDAHDRPLPPGGGALTALARIVPPDALPDGLAKARLVVLHDVDNPLCGLRGAAPIYAPQKGADPAAVEHLAAGLDRFGAVCAETFGRDPRTHPGTGAAGGLAAALWSALGAELRPGFEALADRLGLDAALDAADLVITGEGRVDAQTTMGKTVGALTARAAARDLPTWAFAGQIDHDAPDIPGLALIPIADGPRPLAESLALTLPLLERAAERTARLASTIPR